MQPSNQHRVASFFEFERNRLEQLQGEMLRRVVPSGPLAVQTIENRHRSSSAGAFAPSRVVSSNSGSAHASHNNSVITSPRSASALGTARDWNAQQQQIVASLSHSNVG